MVKKLYRWNVYLRYLLWWLAQRSALLTDRKIKIVLINWSRDMWLRARYGVVYDSSTGFGRSNICLGIGGTSVYLQRLRECQSLSTLTMRRACACAWRWPESAERARAARPATPRTRTSRSRRSCCGNKLLVNIHETRQYTHKWSIYTTQWRVRRPRGFTEVNRGIGGWWFNLRPYSLTFCTYFWPNPPISRISNVSVSASESDR